MLALALILGALASCPAAPDPKKIPPEVYPLVVEFFEEAAARGFCYPRLGELTILLVPAFPGLPYRAGEQLHNQIRISLRWWRDYDANRRRALLFHELGHWIGRDHVCSGTKADPCVPEDSHELMFPYVLDGEAFALHRKAILDCLFSAVFCPGW